jgi:hypothetical protein
MASQIIFIRHGEKTKKDDVNLSPLGYKRAEKLVEYFINSKTLKVPYKIIAMKQGHKDSSNRSYETVQPLAKHLNLKISDHYTREEIKEVAEYIKEQESIYSVILVCWEHSCIPKIVEKLLNLKYDLNWGLNPESNEESDNFTAVWVLEDYKLSVYKQADIYEKNNHFMVDESNDEVVKTMHLK